MSAWWFKDLAVPTPQTRVVYVNKSAEANGDGNSWETAFTDLQLGIEIADADPIKTEVWVAEGIYKTDDNEHCKWHGSDARGYAFHLHDGLGVFGGFQGWENSTETRAGSREATILTAVMSDDVTHSYNVTRQYNGTGDAYGSAHTAVTTYGKWDGFTMRDADLNGSNVSTYDRSLKRGAAGWIYDCQNFHATNLIITHNTGAGGFSSSFYFQKTSAVFDHSYITDCHGFASTSMYMWDSCFVVCSHTIFSNMSQESLTRTDAGTGGISVSLGSTLNLTNSLFLNIISSHRIILTQLTSGLFCENCSFIGLSATTLSGGVSTIFSSFQTVTMDIRNCLTSSISATFTHVLYKYTAATVSASNNISDAPATIAGFSVISDAKLADPDNGDYRLQEDSPAREAGDNQYVTESTDLDGNPRINRGTVDIGCYEYQGA